MAIPTQPAAEHPLLVPSTPSRTAQSATDTAPAAPAPRTPSATTLAAKPGPVLGEHGALGVPAAIAAGHASSIVVHHIAPTDTLEGICVMYGVRAADVKRHNRLWTSDSLFLHRTIEIPLPPDSLAHPRRQSLSSKPSGVGDGSTSATSSSSCSSIGSGGADPLSGLPGEGTDVRGRRESAESRRSAATSMSTATASPSAAWTPAIQAVPGSPRRALASSPTPSQTPSTGSHHAQHHSAPTVSDLLKQIDADVDHILSALEESFAHSTPPPITNDNGSLFPPPAPQASHSIARIIHSEVAQAPVHPPGTLVTPGAQHQHQQHSYGSGARDPLLHDPLWTASLSTARVKILPMSSQAAAAHTAATAPLRVLFEWTPLFADVLPPDIQQSVEDDLRGRLIKRLSEGSVGRELVVERVHSGSHHVWHGRGAVDGGSGLLGSRSSARGQEWEQGEWVGLKDM